MGEKKDLRTCLAASPQVSKTSMDTLTQLELFRQNLPEKPYCTNRVGDAGYSLVRPKAIAERYRYIQHNHPNSRTWMVYDVDRSTSVFDWQDRGAPPPNIIATNLENGHSHLFYGLEEPVHLNHESRVNPIRYHAAVDVALSQKLDADPGYVGLLSKNPLRDDSWYVQTFQPWSYSLGWLADYLDLGELTDRRRNLPEIGLGRNCTLFDRTRFWAYRKIRECWLSREFFESAVAEYAMGYNALNFTVPLPASEVRATIRSIAKWTWTHMSPEGFNRWAEARREKSLAVRREKRDEKLAQILAAVGQYPHATHAQISLLTGIPRQTISRLLADAGKR